MLAPLRVAAVQPARIAHDVVGNAAVHARGRPGLESAGGRVPRTVADRLRARRSRRRDQRRRTGPDRERVRQPPARSPSRALQCSTRTGATPLPCWLSAAAGRRWPTARPGSAAPNQRGSVRGTVRRCSRWTAGVSGWGSARTPAPHSTSPAPQRSGSTRTWAGWCTCRRSCPEQEARAVVLAQACRAFVVFASFARPDRRGYAATAGVLRRLLARRHRYCPRRPRRRRHRPRHPELDDANRPATPRVTRCSPKRPPARWPGEGRPAAAPPGPPRARRRPARRLPRNLAVCGAAREGVGVPAGIRSGRAATASVLTSLDAVTVQT